MWIEIFIFPSKLTHTQRHSNTDKRYYRREEGDVWNQSSAVGERGND